MMTEVKKTVDSIKSVREEGDLCFALLCDTHLCDEGESTREHIRAVDKEIDFDFIMHLGGVLNGDNPEMISRRLLRMEIERYRSCIGSQKFFLSLGETDGWRDERFLGQLAVNIVTDEMWHEETSYIDRYDGVVRSGNKPYYYVDLPEARLIVLSSYYYQIDKNIGLFEKYLTHDVEQMAWLKTEALAGCEGKKVLIFGHRIPKSRFENGADPFIYQGFSTEPLLAILQQAQRRGVQICCRFGGGYGYDSEIRVADIPHAVISSQLPKTVTSAKCDGVRFAPDHTINRDCWDAVVLKRETGILHLIRFGAGEDRIIS